MAKRRTKTIVARNTFNKGMNQDTAISLYDKEKYFFAENARVTTDESGLSSGSISSIKGNTLDLTIPSVGNVYRVRILQDYIDSELNGTSQTFNLSIGANVHNISFATTEQGFFYETIANYINAGNYGTNIIAQYDARTLIIFTNDASTITSITTTETAVDITQIVTSSSNLEVIGSTPLRDSIVLFTAPSTANGSGQVWELTYDSSDVPTLRLVRNMNDNFSTAHPIEAVSRYEIEGIRKVYWTDDNEQIRFLNIDSLDAYIDTIDIIPGVEFDQPIPTSVDSNGGLSTGLYAASYRLKSLGGSETSFSRFSPLVRVNVTAESSQYIDYVGDIANTAATKSITFNIDNLDPQFDFIDILVAKYDGTNVVRYYLVEEATKLNGANTYEFTVSTISNDDLQDSASILIPPSTFLRAKTLTIKDNRLLPANVRDIDLTLEDYDTTAIRYDTNGNTDGYEATSDKKNKYNKDSTRALTDAYQQKYQSDGVTLGGTGANISFKFITEEFTIDSTGGTGTHPSPYYPSSLNVGNDNVRQTVNGGMADKTLNGKTLPMNNRYKSYKNPLFEAWFKGYFRSEVYRFAIVFFDKKGRSSEAKWIADIRMPDQAEVTAFYQTSGECIGKALGLEFTVTVTDDIKSKFSGFSIVRSDRNSNDSTIVAQGIVGDFEGITARSDGSDGFPNGSFSMLLRTDRLLHYGKNMNHRFKTIDVPDFNFKGTPNLNQKVVRPVSSLKVSHIGYMDDSDTTPILSTGDNHGMFAKYYNGTGVRYFGSNSASDNPTTLSKTIDDYISVDYDDKTSQDSMFASIGYEGVFNYAGWVASNSGYNYTINTAGAGSNEFEFASKGTEAVIVDLGDMLPVYNSNGGRVLSSSQMGYSGWGVSLFPNPSVYTANSYANSYGNRLIVNVYNEVANQYGGDNQSAILRSTYITTNHYTPFKSQDNGNTYIAQVYGGDTYISAYSESHSMANHNAGAAAANVSWYPGDHRARLSAQIFPIETILNLELREGRNFNNIGCSTEGGDSANVMTFYLPNDTYTYRRWQDQEQNGIEFESLSAFRNNAVEYDNRIHASDPKVNGEPGDSWTSFKVNNYIDVDGNHGPINKIITFKDIVLYFQDRAFGNVAVNPRVAVQGTDSVNIELGTGDVLHDFHYYSTTIGTKHQWSVFQSPDAVYWFNILNKKTYRYYGAGPEDLVDIKGMHSYFANNIDQTLVALDNPLLNTGIHGTYDFLNKEAIFTFLSPKAVSTTTVGLSLGEVSASDALSSPPNTGGIGVGTGTDTGIDIPIYVEPEGFTIAFSETVDAWTSFYKFLPPHYINGQNRLLTPNTLDRDTLYRHNIGSYLNFYGAYSPMKLDIVVSPYANETKIFDNISFHTMVKNNDNHGIDQSTFGRFNCNTEYQHSGPIVLSPESTIKKREREWQLDVPRNVMTEFNADINLFDPVNYDYNKNYFDRMRDKYLIERFEKDGSTNEDQFVVNYINTHLRVSDR